METDSITARHNDLRSYFAVLAVIRVYYVHVKEHLNKSKKKMIVT